MATGDVADITNRIQALIPSNWFPAGDAPILTAEIEGAASALSFDYDLLAYIRQQTRIATATDGFLDLIAYDFFGTHLVRSIGQSDASFRRQIIATLFRLRNTRPAIDGAIFSLLGTHPTIIEPMRPPDTGVYDNASVMAYDVAGCYGDSAAILHSFIQVTIPTSLSIAPPNVGGYGSNVSAYNGGITEYIGKPSVDPVQIADVCQALEAVRPVTGVFHYSIATGVPTATTPSVTIDTTQITIDNNTLTVDGGSK